MNHGGEVSPATGRGIPGNRAVGLTAWGQVVLASVLMVATRPGRTQGLGLVTEPLLKDLHLERLTYAELNLWATLVGSMACLPVGWAIDRWGLRWVAASVSLALGWTVWRLSVATGGLVALFGLLLATRALGQSGLSVCSIATVGKWFSRRVGFAMGVFSVLLSVLFAVAFVAVGHSVNHNGWRVAWWQIAVGLVFGITPLALFALKEPTTCRTQLAAGMEPTGSASAHSSGSTMADALRTRAFWVFAGAAALFNLVSSGLGLFNEAVLAERGFDRATFHQFLAFSTVMSLVGQFGCGWLSTCVRLPVLTMVSLLLYATGLAVIPEVHALWQLWLVATLLGVAGGMIIVIFFAVWNEAFGSLQLGRIQGAAQMLTVLASGLGPVLFARCAEHFGSYMPLLLLLAASVVVLALIAVTVRLPMAESSVASTAAGPAPHRRIHEY